MLWEMTGIENLILFIINTTSISKADCCERLSEVTMNILDDRHWHFQITTSMIFMIMAVEEFPQIAPNTIFIDEIVTSTQQLPIEIIVAILQKIP